MIVYARGGLQSNTKHTLSSPALTILEPPNAMLAAYMAEQGVNIGFGQWMLVGVPVAVVLMAAAWYLLTGVIFKPEIDHIPGGRALMKEELILEAKTEAGATAICTSVDRWGRRTDAFLVQGGPAVVDGGGSGSHASSYARDVLAGFDRILEVSTAQRARRVAFTSSRPSARASASPPVPAPRRPRR